MTQLARSGFIKKGSQDISAETLTKAQVDLEEQWTKLTRKFTELVVQFEIATGV